MIRATDTSLRPGEHAKHSGYISPKVRHMGGRSVRALDNLVTELLSQSIHRNHAQIRSVAIAER